MRKLTTPDAFECIRIIKKANLKEEIKPYVKQAASGSLNVEDIGIEGMFGLLEIMTEKKAENALYEVLAGPFEMTVEEIKKLDINTMAQNLKQIEEENNLKSFFSFVSGLISKI